MILYDSVLRRFQENFPEIWYLSDVVSNLGESVDRDISVCLEIRRSCVVKDALREAWISKFNPQGLLKVSSSYNVYE